MNEVDAKQAGELISQAKNIVVVQAENPDGDSLASSLALEEILGDQNKDVSLFCLNDMPRYLRYHQGWDRVSSNWPKKTDLIILVDTSTPSLISKTLKLHKRKFVTNDVLIIDHHVSSAEFSFDVSGYMDSNAAATGQLIYRLSQENNWDINPQAAMMLVSSIGSDTRGFITDTVTSETMHVVGDLVEKGANLSKLATLRREFDQMPKKVYVYKGELIQRVNYELDERVATVEIPWKEIEEYSDLYNPSELVIYEMLMIDTVDLSVAFKIYDDKVTAKIRANIPIANVIAEWFGGGGHPMAAGCKVRDIKIDEFKKQFLQKAKEVIDEYDSKN